MPDQSQRPKNENRFLLIFWLIFAFSIIPLFLTPAYAGITTEEFCAEMDKSLMDLCQRNYLRWKDHLPENVREKIESEIKTCPEIPDFIPKAFRQPPTTRDNILISDLVKEIARRSGSNPDDLFKGYRIKKKPDRWHFFKDGKLQYNTRIPIILGDYQKELKRLKFPHRSEDLQNVLDGWRKHQDKFHPPQKAIRVDDGWLVGSNRGEWGGYLGFVSTDNTFELLLDENVLEIFQTPKGITIITGLAHLGIYKGNVFRAQKLDSHWKIVQKTNLYKPPYIYHQQKDGSIIIGNTVASFWYNTNGLCLLD